MTKKKPTQPFKDDKIDNLPPPDTDRSDKILYERRVNVVVDEILKGSLSENIIARVCAEWVVSRAQAYRYIDDAIVRINETTKEHRAKDAEVMFERYMYLYRQQCSSSNYAEARKTLDSMCRLMGLNKEQPEGKGERPTTFIINTGSSNGHAETSVSVKEA